MKLLKEIYHKKNINKKGKAIKREAVRSIILDDDKVLMVYSSRNGDYKFPGGGIESDETHKEALIREVQEECGALVSIVMKEIGKVIEYNKPVEDEYDVFKMTSYYYLCKVKENYCKQNLDEYEENLGFKPVWISIEEAIQNNNLIINSDLRETPIWTGRDTFILEYIQDILKK